MEIIIAEFTVTDEYLKSVYSYNNMKGKLFYVAHDLWNKIDLNMYGISLGYFKDNNISEFIANTNIKEAVNYNVGIDSEVEFQRFVSVPNKKFYRLVNYFDFNF